MPLIHLEFKPLNIGTDPQRQPPLIESWAAKRRCSMHCDMSRRPGLTAKPSSGKAAPPPRPDGGVVTQRTANPCTPVRFRLGPPTPSKISQFCGIFLAVIHFRALSRSHPRRCPPGAARTTRSTNLSGPLLRPCMFIAHEPQKPLPEFEVGVRNVLHGIPFGGRALVRLVSTLSHRRRASMSFSGHSAGTAAAPVRGSSILPRGLRSFMRKSHPISSEPTEKTMSPGMRIHCQNRYWS